MAERRVSITVDIDLAKGSKEAHARTVQRVASCIAEHAVDMMEESGYTVRAAAVNTTMHYVRHSIDKVIRSPRKKRLRVVRSTQADKITTTA